MVVMVGVNGGFQDSMDSSLPGMKITNDLGIPEIICGFVLEEWPVE